MPEKSLSVVSYAAGASLAAIALVYVFAPTYFIDGEGAAATGKKGIVGLRNAANDCFINSVLQALAGLGELRLYLIRESHRRAIDDPAVYAYLVQPPHKKLPDWKVRAQQEGLVTVGLKAMLDRLNERPINKKAISAIEFVKVLEQAFRQRISRQQQDAQEFLQIVAETLKEEYHAGQRARDFARKQLRSGPVENGVALEATDDNGEALRGRLQGLAIQNGTSTEPGTSTAAAVPVITTSEESSATKDAEEEDGFPMEGRYESQTTCQTCGFKTKPKEEGFCTLTLNVPQVSSTSLSACFDDVFKTEYIDDYKCDKCRLLHAKQVFEEELAQSTSDSFKAKGRVAIERLQYALDTDPEKLPEGVELPDSRYAPKRRISRATRMTKFPKILAIHLSRSIYGSDQVSQKNSAKVSFPERLPVGGLTDRKNYKLLALVTHKGSHHSGHYESFRRQKLADPPFSNSNAFQQSGVYSKTASPSTTPQVGAVAPSDSPMVSTPDLLSAEPGANSSTPSLESSPASSEAGTLRSGVRNASGSVSSRLGVNPSAPMPEKDAETASMRSVAASAISSISKMSASKRTNGAAGDAGSPNPPGTANAARPLAPRSKKRRATDRWWRISDEKVRECRTGEVLGMQREVYLLFYELDKDDV